MSPRMSEHTVSFQPLSGRIYAGTVNKTRTAFASKTDVTNQAVAQVAEYIAESFPEGMVLRAPDGSGWEIAVKRIEETR